MAETKGSPVSTDPTATGTPKSMEGRRGPTWRGWALSILVAVILSVATTLLLCGSDAFRSDRATAAGRVGSGSNCCPPAVMGK